MVISFSITGGTTTNKTEDKLLLAEEPTGTANRPINNKPKHQVSATDYNLESSSLATTRSTNKTEEKLLVAEEPTANPINNKTKNQVSATDFDSESSSLAKTKTSTNDTCVTPELIGNWTYSRTGHNATGTDAMCCLPISNWYPNPNYSLNHTQECDVRVPIYNTHSFEGNTLNLAWTIGCGEQCQRFKDSFHWKSSNLPQWNAQEFCQLLGPRRIILIGDSTMYQSAHTLMNAVHGHCQTQMSLFLGETLIQQHFRVMNRGVHWLEIAQNHAITRDDDIVVLTVGAHLAQKSDLSNVSNVVIQQIVVLKIGTAKLDYYLQVTAAWRLFQADCQLGIDTLGGGTSLRMEKQAHYA